MSECTHDCSSCGESCGERTAPMDFRAPMNPLSDIKKVIAVVSGKGGVGKSTVTCTLAAAMAQRGKKTAVLDADITGPSVPTAFGIHEHAALAADHGDDLAHAGQAVDRLSQVHGGGALGAALAAGGAIMGAF